MSASAALPLALFACSILAEELFGNDQIWRLVAFTQKRGKAEVRCGYFSSRIRMLRHATWKGPVPLRMPWTWSPITPLGCVL